MNSKLFDNIIKKSFAMFDLPQGRSKHFSFLIKKNNVLSFGWNIVTKTHPWAVKYNYKYPFIHSELMCIKNFPLRPAELERCTLVNTRIGMDRKLKLSRPCECCQRMLIAFNISEVYFTNNNEVFSQM